MNRITLLQAAALLVILIAAAFSAASISAEPTGLNGITVCLDPGHGGSDPGAVNAAFALHESDINLDVSFGLQSLLEEAGAEVVLTRTDDTYLTNADRYTFCNEQEATILVSVHTNSVTYEDWDGSMALYAPSRDADLARAIHEEMYPFLRDTAPAGVEDFRDHGIDNFASGVLFKCNMPAAMMEPLFMSHPAEAALLVEPIYGDDASTCSTDFACRRGQIAKAIYLGIENYFGDEETPDMHVAAIEMTYKQRKATNFVTSQVTVQDSGGAPVAGATVAHTFTLPNGSSSVQTAVTSDDGATAFKVRSGLSGPYKSAVTSISKTGWLYDPADNLETSEILLVP